MMDQNTTVPIGWLVAAGALAVTMFVWWLRAKFAAGEKSEQDNLAEHGRMYATIQRIEKKLDHLLLYHQPKVPPYNPDG